MFFLAGLLYGLSPRHCIKDMSSDTCRLLARTLCFPDPSRPVHCRSDISLVPNSIPLAYKATFFDYVVLKGKRYYASRSVGSSNSSFVRVTIPRNDLQISLLAFGEVLEVFQFSQLFYGQECTFWFARMHWFKAYDGPCEKVWSD